MRDPGHRRESGSQPWCNGGGFSTGDLEGRHGRSNIDFREPALQIFFRSERAEPDVMHNFARILEDGIDLK